jgi:hypothetical protein
VTGTGIASVAHQTAINVTTAATDQAEAFNPLGIGRINSNKNTDIPIKKPLFLYVCI